MINDNLHDRLINYQTLGTSVRLAVPTPEHYLPMLYAIALQQKDESVAYFNDKPVAGSPFKTSFVVGE
jgi:4,5-DOPA dioxygenase extradiol